MAVADIARLVVAITTRAKPISVITAHPTFAVYFHTVGALCFAFAITQEHGIVTLFLHADVFAACIAWSTTTLPNTDAAKVTTVASFARLGVAQHASAAKVSRFGIIMANHFSRHNMEAIATITARKGCSVFFTVQTQAKTSANLDVLAQFSRHVAVAFS